MKETIKVVRRNEALSLATDIAFSSVPAWYGGTVRDLKMDIVFPKVRDGHPPQPAVVWICGGAYMTMDRSIWLPQLFRIANAGFAVASIEYRTSNEAQFPAQLIDIKSAVRFLKANAKEFSVDPDNIFVMGESAGGCLASLTGVSYLHKEYEQGRNLAFDSSVRGVIDFYGPAILKDHFEAISDDVPDWTMRAYLGAHYTAEDQRKISADTYFDAELPPFFLIHGKDDPIVPVEQSEYYYEVLKKAGADVSLLIVEDAVHGDELCYQSEVMDRIIAFMERTRR